MFRISEFSHLVRISPRMLRHYEKCGLLFPARIDLATGYRQYSAGQIPLAQSIVLLRELGFSIEEMGEILPRMGEPAYMSKVLRAKAEAVQAIIQTEQHRLCRLLEMSDTVRKERNIMIYEVELKSIPAIQVLSLRDTIPKYNEEQILWDRLGAYIEKNSVQCLGGGYSTYFDEAYTERDPDVEIAVPVAAPGRSEGAFVYKTYPQLPLAATLRFTGPFDGGYDAATEKLARWMEDSGYSFSGPLRGHIITPPDEEPNPEKWEVELQAPVVKN